MKESKQEDQPGKVPIFGNWNYWYLLVIGLLVLLMAGFYMLTKHFS